MKSSRVLGPAWNSMSSGKVDGHGGDIVTFIETARTSVIQSCPLFLHAVAMLSVFTLMLHDEIQEHGSKQGSLSDGNFVASLLNELLEAPQIYRLLQLFYGMQDALMLPFLSERSSYSLDPQGFLDADKEMTILLSRLKSSLVADRFITVGFYYICNHLNICLSQLLFVFVAAF